MCYQCIIEYILKYRSSEYSYDYLLEIACNIVNCRNKACKGIVFTNTSRDAVPLN